MGRQRLFDGQCFLARSPHRQFRTGDLMIGIAMAALGLSVISLPNLTGRERLFLGLFAVAFLTMLWAQWALVSVPSTGVRPLLRSCRLRLGAHGVNHVRLPDSRGTSLPPRSCFAEYDDALTNRLSDDLGMKPRGFSRQIFVLEC